MTSFADMTAPPRQIDYLEAAADSAYGRDYKERFLVALDVRAGHAVLDVGCGPGTDLARLASAVTPTGAVIGVDRDEEMLTRARQRLTGQGNVDVRRGDAHELPAPDSSVDRARADRVLQHLEDPARAVAEMRRVLRPGGVVGLAEPDWDTLAVDGADVSMSRVFTSFMAGQVRNPTIGRQLVRLTVEAGFSPVTFDAAPVVFRDFAPADEILGLRRNLARAVAAGRFSEPAARSWLAELETGPFLAWFSFVTVTAQA